MEPGMLAALYAYNTYANQLVLETAARLTEAEFTQRSSPSRESVHVLLRHLLATEMFFLKSCQDRTLPPQLDQLLRLRFTPWLIFSLVIRFGLVISLNLDHLRQPDGFPRVATHAVGMMQQNLGHSGADGSHTNKRDLS